MFSITLEFKDNKIASCYPPCYGFLRGAEWGDWDQTFHHNSWAIKYTLRDRLYSNDGITPERPFGDHLSHTTWEDGEGAIPSEVFNLSDLVTIWNSGARVPFEAYVNSEDTSPKAWRFPDNLSGDGTTYDLSKITRSKSTLDCYNERNNTNLTLRKVMTDFEQAIDAGRESVLRWRDNGHGEFMGVSTVDVPCDRVLFYLMVGRELDSFYCSPKGETFLRLHYGCGVPIMIAFMVSRLLIDCDNSTVFSGDMGDSCILPSQNFWVGCGARYTKPTAVTWQQHAYSSGSGHDRDDDLGGFYMEPVIEGFGAISEEFNEVMFNAVFGGHIDSSSHVLLDQPGGKPVANLVAEFFRAVATPTFYRNRGDSNQRYCSNWTSDRALYDETPSSWAIPKSCWTDKLISLLTEE